MQKINITSQGREAYSLIFTPQDNTPTEPLPAIIMARGYPSSPQTEWTETAQRIADRSNIVTVLFDYSGAGTNHPESGNDTSVEQHLSDLINVFDNVIALPFIDERRVCVYGNSYGAFFAAWVTSQRAVHGVRLGAPALYPQHALNSSPNTFVKIENEILSDALAEKSQNIAMKALSGYSGHVLIIEHGADELIPKEAINRYIQHSKNAKTLEHQVIQGAGHYLSEPAWRSETEKYLANWLQKIL